MEQEPQVETPEEERKPRWLPEETRDTAWEMANLVDKHQDLIQKHFDQAHPPQPQLRNLGGILDQQIAKVAAGPALVTDQQLATVMAETPNWITGVREAVKRLFPQDDTIRKAFGVGVPYRRDHPDGVLGQLSQSLVSLSVHPQAAAKLNVDSKSLDLLGTYQKTLSDWVQANPRASNRPANPDIQQRNRIQFAIEDLVDQVIARVAIRCWQTPHILPAIKDALPSRPYRNTSTPSNEKPSATNPPGNSPVGGGG